LFCTGHAVDYRFLVFGVLVIYVAIQAHAKPYILASDNALEQCTLIALMLIIFLDIGTAIPIFAESDKSGSIMSKLQVRTVAVLIITVLVFVLVMAHKSANAKAAKLAKIGVVTTSKVFLRTKADKHDDDVMDDPRVSDHENSSRKAANKAKKERIETENSEIILRHGLTEAEVKQYRAAFAVFDDGDTGTVDAAELGHLFTMMGQAVDNIQEYMKEFDGDGSGKVRDWLLVGIIASGRTRILCTRSVLPAGLHRDGGTAGHAKAEAKGRRRGNAAVRHAHQLARVERRVRHHHGRDARARPPGVRAPPGLAQTARMYLRSGIAIRALNLAHIFGQPCAIFALSRTCLSKSSGSSRLRTTRPRR
jgi:hypothetical protein